MNNEILKLAQQLGEMIANSEEIKVFREAERLYYEDETAQSVMQQYEKERAGMTVRAKESGLSKDALLSFQQEMKASMDKLTENETVKRYLDAKSNFNDIIQKVNAIISYCIQGEEQDLASEGSCSGNCAACGGCH